MKRCKKFASLLLAFCMVISLLPITAVAESETQLTTHIAATITASGYCGGEDGGKNLRWELDSKGTLTISGNGEMANYKSVSPTLPESPWYQYKDFIFSVYINEGVSTIGDGAFIRHSNLQNLNIPASLKSIGMYSFGYCDALTEVVLPQGLTRIYQHAFDDCGNLTYISLPESVEIDSGVFEDCHKLKTAGPLEGDYNIEYSWTTNIPRYAFSYCESLEKVFIPTTISFIGAEVFRGCVGLTDIYYWGSQEEWEKIYIGYKNDEIINANIHYNYDNSNGESEPDIAPIPEEPSPAPATPSTRLIDSDQVHIEQSNKSATKGTCTLASAAMMLRRRAISDGRSDWSDITETSVGKVAWVSGGLSHNFSYQGMSVVTIGKNFRDATETVEAKKDYLKSLLETRPEGIVAYNWSHAILITDYDPYTDTFYCMDPMHSMPTDSPARKPLVQSSWNSTWINGRKKTQDELLINIKQLWYVTQNNNKQPSTSTTYITSSYTEMVVEIGGYTLDSRNLVDSVSNSYASMSASGTGKNRQVIVRVTNTLENNIRIRLFGINSGNASLTVVHEFDDGTSVHQGFEMIPVTAGTICSINSIDIQESLVMTVTNSAGAQEIWTANPGEIVRTPIDLADSENNADNEYAAIYNDFDGFVGITPQSAGPGESVTILIKPENGYELNYLVVTDDDNVDIPLDEHKDGKYTFTMPYSDVRIKFNFKESEESNQPIIPILPSTPEPTEISSFEDVSAGAYYYEAIQWAVDNGITSGISDTSFGPDQTCTRAQAMTFLWRAAGSPEPSSSNSFRDVSPEAWYAGAVQWAVENGITGGTGPDTFSPDAVCSRGQIMTFLWRAQNSPESGGSGRFSDVSDSAYYAKAVHWAIGAGITSGTSDSTFSPDDDCTRAQIMAFLYQCYKV